MWKRPFILFFSLLLISFLIYWPSQYKYYRKRVDVVPESEREFQGIITLMDFPHPTAKDPSGFAWIREEISRFQKKNPGVVIDLVPLNAKDGYARLESAAMTKAYPDIAPVGGNYWYISKGILQPLNACIDNKETYIPGVLDQVCKDDNIYGLPWAVTSDVLFANKDLLDGFGLNEEKGLNVADFNNLLANLEENNKSKKNDKIYALGGYIDVDDYTLLPLLFKDGGIYNEDGNPDFDRIKEGYLFFSNLGKRGLLTSNYGTIYRSSAWDKFIKDGKTVFMPGNISDIIKLKDKSDTEFDAISYPSDAAATKRVIAYSVFKQNDPKKMQMIMKFLKQITSEEKQVKLKDFNLIPVYRSQNGLYSGDKLMEKINGIIDETQYLPRSEHFEMLDEIIMTHLRQVVLDAEDPDEAAEETKREYNEYISTMSKDKTDK